MPIFLERPQSQGVIEFWKHLLYINCIRHAIVNHHDMMIMPWNCQVLFIHMCNILCHNCSNDVSRNRVCIYGESRFTLLRSCKCRFAQNLVNCFQYTTAYYRVSQCRCLNSLLIESLWVFYSPQFYKMLPQEKICVIGLLERKKSKKEKEKKKKTALLPFYMLLTFPRLRSLAISVNFLTHFWGLLPSVQVDAHQEEKHS